MKQKHLIVIFFSCIILLIITIFLVDKYKELKEYQKTDTNENISRHQGLSMMIETSAGSGEYVQSTSSEWPTDGYVFNETLSKCENGGTLSWNSETHSVILKTNMSDKCYVYFDVEPPDVLITANNVPTTYGKLGSVSCTDGTATYNQKYNRIEVSQISGKYASCTLNYTDSTSKVNLASYITGLSGTTQGTGQVVNENGYRYEGKNPNNYVWFNNEYWRIIGVFDSNSHGQSDKNLVKIIRAEQLDALALSNAYTTDWSSVDLNSLLNKNYYNAIDGTNSGDCISSAAYQTEIKGNCDYTKRGIQLGYRSMITNVTWYLGGYPRTSVTAEESYRYERGTTVYSYGTTRTIGYIGLMYPSDYGYSVLSSICARTTNLGSYNSSSCAGASWLYGKGNEWTLTPYSSNYSEFFFLNNRGYLSYSEPHYGYSARPVLYLDSSVYKIRGSGTLSDPYIIGM